MSSARITTFAFAGIDPVPVEVQVQISSGLPAFLLVGLADKAVTESRERVRAALTAIGLSLPPKRILVNLAPADLAKEGSHYDLPIALAVLAAMEVIPAEELAGFAAMGELALDGFIQPVAGVLAAALGASQREQGLICPAAQGPEAAWAGRVAVLAPDNLMQLLNHLRGTQALEPPAPPMLGEAPAGTACLSDVIGQETAKRALEVAAAGSHNMLMQGPPGSGKSMLAARLAGLLPPLTAAQALEVSLVYSVAGLLRDGRLLQRPPFRAPHHSASQPALVGGGPRARPGEISLAHHGVLFLDEWPEFARPALEALRQPMESGEARIARAHAHITWPARFQCIAAMNPCRCGHLGDASRECTKAPRCGEEYLSRLSGPLLDRMDINIEVQPVAHAELSRAPRGETSAVVAARVAAAREFAAARGAVPAEATLTDAARTLAETAAERLRLSTRGFLRAIRVARSIADLTGSDSTERVHVAEALSFRLRG
ncbi:YifB family Mg chelatase-like AAA ATPase [Rhodovarius lipocyclicus]|uniref:YifB family Mg chelatase-like AAA ATPase n=1 Tax=Rhodovarius lipocyclicus TaxID=268410 RepID=UPI001356CAA9|nr:YifB family Mg chelatase-like AAA ATPase [Rhodovarius lipocyclicus]